MMSEMKILVPLNNELLAEQYAKAGADQFYFGFYDTEWTERFGKNADINRMSSFGTRANRFSFEKALEVIDRIGSMGCETYITFNANLYTDDEKEFLAERIHRLALAGVTGVILSDTCLLKYASDAGIKAVASTMTGIYNRDIMEYYVSKGFKRIIVPREISLSEIKMLHEAFPDIEIEAFYMRNGCIYSDSNCLTNHRFGGICSFTRKKNGRIKVSDFSSVSKEKLSETLDLYNRKLMTGIACGHCALFDLKEAGVTALKIVGRADREDQVIEDIKTTVANIRIAYESLDREDYMSKVQKRFSPINNCESGWNCYYRSYTND